MRLFKTWLAIAATIIGLAGVASAQGVQTGTITGTVKSSDGLSLPGTTVTAQSPALQGLRTAVSDVNGVYVIKGLPPGTYTVKFEIANFKPVTKEDIALNVGGTAEINQVLALGAVTETITVTAT